MKKIILLKSFLLFAVFGSQAQPFQQSFINSTFPTYSEDHYSIETGDSDFYAYACAGTFFNGTQTMLHVFTIDAVGGLIWENYVNLGSTNIRILDVAIGRESDVAVTGFIDQGFGQELYAALYDNVGNFVNDFQYTAANNTTGNNIIYSAANDQFIIGGFESAGYSISGDALLVALDGSFNYQWSTTYTNASCGGFFDTSTINEIVEVNGSYFITGNLSSASSPFPYGQSQVLVAVVDNTNGAIIDNESFAATNTLGGQQAMGVSAYYDPEAEALYLMYNVSISPTVDENRPYIAVYKVSGTDLTYGYGFRIEDTFVTNPSTFVSNPNFTGLKLLPNKDNNSFVIFGMIEAYGANDKVLSVYQEVDLSGIIMTPAKYWTLSEIPDAYPFGYPSHGGFYSLFDDFILNSEVYTPESTTLNIDRERFVSILPTGGGGSYSFDIISSVLTTSGAISDCLEEFEMKMVPHEIYEALCLEAFAASGTVIAPGYYPTPISSTLDPTCEIINSPAMGNSEFDLENTAANELNLYANPATDVLRFTVSETGTYDLMIMDMEGRILVQNQFNNTANQHQINIAHLAAGTYILAVINHDGQSIKKQFIKE